VVEEATVVVDVLEVVGAVVVDVLEVVGAVVVEVVEVVVVVAGAAQVAVKEVEWARPAESVNEATMVSVPAVPLLE